VLFIGSREESVEFLRRGGKKRQKEEETKKKRKTHDCETFRPAISARRFSPEGLAAAAAEEEEGERMETQYSANRYAPCPASSPAATRAHAPLPSRAAQLA